MTPYDKVIEAWDTQEMEELDRLVYLLCEHHLVETQEAKKEEEYFSFDRVQSWLYPYEILAWLKLREFKGLKNPSKFTHPLMKTSIVEFILSLETPLPYPTELPYANELLEMVKKECPKVVIPEWLK